MGDNSMVARKEPTDETLGRAAEMRAAGTSWEKIGEEVGRAADTVRRWPSIYRIRWQRMFARAEHVLLTEATAEAVLTLRRQLRSEDEKTAREAAQKLVQLRIAFKRRRKSASGASHNRLPADISDGRRIANHLGGLTDVQIEQLLADLPAASCPDGSVVVGESS